MSGGGSSSATASFPAGLADLVNSMQNQFDWLAHISSQGLPLVTPPSARNYPDLPSMSGVLSGAGLPKYDIPGYDVSDYQKYLPQGYVAPTEDWYSKLSGGVKAGIRAPWEEGSQALEERLNKFGQLGSARGGISGQAAGGLGEYWSDAEKNMGMQAWGMTSPGLMAQYQLGGQAGLAQSAAETARNQNIWELEAEKARNLGLMGYQNVLTERQTDYQNKLQSILGTYQNLKDYDTQLFQAKMAPWQLMPTYAGTISQVPMIGSSSSSQPWTSGLMQAGAGAYGLSQLPWKDMGSGLMKLIGKGATAATAGAACFIFVEADGKVEPCVLKFFLRNMTDKFKRGYHLLSEKLVPMIALSEKVRQSVLDNLVRPVTEYARFIAGESKDGAEMEDIAMSWIKVFEAIGDRKPIVSKLTGEVI